MRYIFYIIIGCLGIACGSNDSKPSATTNEEGEMKEVYDAYMQELNEFDSLSQMMANSTSIDSINFYTSLIESKFANSSNVNIKDKYSRVFDFAFSSMTKTADNTTDAYKICLSDPNTVSIIKSKCLNRLTSQLLRNNKIAGAYYHYEVLDDETKSILMAEEKEGYNTIADYLKMLEKPNAKGIASDTFDYLQNMEVKSICHSIWLDQEPCKDYNLLDIRLNSFLVKHPESSLADDAQLLIYEHQICDKKDLAVNEAKLKIINYYNLIKKYPKTNLMESIRYRIIKNQLLVPNSEVELKILIEQFEKQFPKSAQLDELLKLRPS